MATSLGSLVVSLGLDAAKFTEGLSKSQFQAQRFTESLGKNFRAAGAAVGAALASGSAIVAAMVKQSIDAADATSKLAQSAGVATETLSALGYAAQLSGSTQEEMGKTLAKLGKAMAEFQIGSGEAAGAFRALGISVEDQSGKLKATDAVLVEIAEKFAGYRDGAEKTALATKLFGEEGVKLIPLLNQGKDGIKAMTDEAAALGIVLDTETGKSAERFNDNLTRLSAAKDGLVQQIMRNLLPSLESLTDQLVTNAKNSGLLKEASEAAATGVRILATAAVGAWGAFRLAAENITSVVSALTLAARGEFRLAWTALQIGGKNTVQIYKDTSSQIQAIWNTTAKNVASSAPKNGRALAAPALQGAASASGAMKKAATDAEREATRIRDMIDGIFVEVETFGMGDSQRKLFDLERMGAGPADLEQARQLLDMLDGLKRGTREAAAFGEKMAEGRRIFEDTRSPAEKLNIDLAKLNELLAAGAINWDTYARAVFKAQEDFDAATQTVDASAERAKETAKDLGLTFSSAFEDAIVGGEGLSDVLKGLEQDIVRIITRKAVTEPLGDWFTKAMSGGSSGSGFGGWISSAIGNLFGGGRAAGGPVQAGRFYQVNERGTELLSVNGRDYLMAGASGRVKPNVQAGGSGGVTVHMTVNARDAESFRRSEGQIVSRLSSVASKASRFR